LAIIPKVIQCEGRVLPPVEIKFGNNAKVKLDEKAQFDIRNVEGKKSLKKSF
jgi:hypothetical protein